MFMGLNVERVGFFNQIKAIRQEMDALDEQFHGSEYSDRYMLAKILISGAAELMSDRKSDDVFLEQVMRATRSAIHNSKWIK